MINKFTFLSLALSIALGLSSSLFAAVSKTCKNKIATLAKKSPTGKSLPVTRDFSLDIGRYYILNWCSLGKVKNGVPLRRLNESKIQIKGKEITVPYKGEFNGRTGLTLIAKNKRETAIFVATLTQAIDFENTVMMSVAENRETLSKMTSGEFDRVLIENSIKKTLKLKRDFLKHEKDLISTYVTEAIIDTYVAKLGKPEYLTVKNKFIKEKNAGKEPTAVQKEIIQFAIVKNMIKKLIEEKKDANYTIILEALEKKLNRKATEDEKDYINGLLFIKNL